MTRDLDLPDRGVRQAGFRVLVGAYMPAVLIELGFLSHAEEERRLGDSRYQRELAAGHRRRHAGLPRVHGRADGRGRRRRTGTRRRRRRRRPRSTPARPAPPRRRPDRRRRPAARRASPPRAGSWSLVLVALVARPAGGTGSAAPDEAARRISAMAEDAGRPRRARPATGPWSWSSPSGTPSGYVTEQRQIPSRDRPGEDLLGVMTRALCEGPRISGAVSALPARHAGPGGLRRPEDQSVVLDFSQELVTGHPGGSAAEAATLTSILRTVALNFPEHPPLRDPGRGRPGRDPRRPPGPGPSPSTRGGGCR